MSNFIETLTEQGFALFYTDDILPFSNSKEHMLQQLHQSVEKKQSKTSS